MGIYIQVIVNLNPICAEDDIPETNSYHLKVDSWKTSFFLGRLFWQVFLLASGNAFSSGIFLGAMLVSGRVQYNPKQNFHLQVGEIIHRNPWPNHPEQKSKWDLFTSIHEISNERTHEKTDPDKNLSIF